MTALGSSRSKRDFYLWQSVITHRDKWFGLSKGLFDVDFENKQLAAVNFQIVFIENILRKIQQLYITL